MLTGHKNTKKQGDVGMGVAIGWFAAQGITVCIPLTDSQDYDLVAEIDGLLKKIQVKTTRYKNKYGIYVCQLKTCGGNQSRNTIKCFDPNSVDYIFILDGDGGKYLIPTLNMSLSSNISLGEKYQEYMVS